MAVPKVAATSASARVEPAELPLEPELDPFFEQSTEQSRVKAAIVADYFETWARVIAPTTKKSGGQRVGYIDLFAGPGRYEDGTKSTPLLILERATHSPALRDMLVSVLNDSAQNHSESLSAAIDALRGIETLRHQPEVNASQVDNALAQALQKARLIPSFFFIDPWGYKGLTLGLLKGAIKDWGSDCVFFFNYTRINMGITNAAVEEHMAGIFGANRLALLREWIANLEPGKREELILTELESALRELGGKFILPFRFRDRHARTTHYLIFVTKHFKGYGLMREIMAKRTSCRAQGVAWPRLEHCLKDVLMPPLDLDIDRPIDRLVEHLARSYSGQTLQGASLFERDSVGTPYVWANYREALLRLEAAGKIVAMPPASQRRKYKGQPTLAPAVRIKFP
jgi:three-Cys-motif partner protein